MPDSVLLSFVVPGPPVSWARASRGRGARAGGAYATFTPAKQRSWAGMAQVHMRAALAGRGPFVDPVAVEIDAYWPRPKSTPKRLGTCARPRPSRPDADNVGKILCDAGNGVLWLDDAQVVRLTVSKWVAAENAAPCVVIVVRAVAAEGRHAS